MNRNDVIDVLSVVAAATRRTVGETDVDVWQAVIGDLSKDLALRAVRDHLRHHPGVWLEPGHVYEGAKVIHRDQLARESREQRESRENTRDAALEARTRERLGAIVEQIGLPLTEFARPSQRGDGSPPALRVQCPYCRAGIGRPCWNSATEKPRREPHPARIEAAA